MEKNWHKEVPETARFLDDDTAVEEGVYLPNTKRSKFCSYNTLLLHLVLIAFYSSISVFTIYKKTHQPVTGYGLTRTSLYSPASESLHTETKWFTISQASAREYFGEPNEEREAAWEDLLSATTIRLTPDDMSRLGRPRGVELPNGDFAGSLNVYHDLHCLRRVGRLLYPDHYFPNMTSQTRLENLEHAQHCLDRLRQSIQCRADVSPLTYMWAKHTPVPIGNLTTPHECVNFDAVKQWAESRKVDMFEPGLIVHPTLGPAYADIDKKPFTGAVHDTALIT